MNIFKIYTVKNQKILSIDVYPQAAIYIFKYGGFR